MQVCVQAQSILKEARKLISNPPPEDVRKWMEGLKLSFMKRPSLVVVKNIIATASVMLSNPDIVLVWDESRAKFGRDSFSIHIRNS